ncbi:MAG: rod shape-determining protein MreD [Nitrospirae bacterium]|nr:rod shape-determining protein MreD [Nitrospirota bacterium]
MKSFLIYLAALFLLMAFQAVFISGAKPDLPLVLVCFYSLGHGAVLGGAFGALAGFIADSASGFLIGPNLFSKFLAALFIYNFRRKFFVWNAVLCMLFITGITAADMAFIFFYIRMFSGIEPPSLFSLTAALQVVYNSAAALLFYRVIGAEDGFPQRAPWMSANT